MFKTMKAYYCCFKNGKESLGDDVIVDLSVERLS